MFAKKKENILYDALRYLEYSPDLRTKWSGSTLTIYNVNEKDFYRLLSITAEQRLTDYGLEYYKVIRGNSAPYKLERDFSKYLDEMKLFLKYI